MDKTMKESNVKIRFPKDWKAIRGTRVWIDGNEINQVKTVGVDHEAGDIRRLTLVLYANIEVTHEELPDDPEWEHELPDRLRRKSKGRESA